MDAIDQIKHDRLLRYIAYAAVPIVWLSVALLNVWSQPAMLHAALEPRPEPQPDAELDPEDDLDFL